MISGDSFVDFVWDQLDGLEGMRARAMFGGFGLYLDDSFFGIIYEDRLYLKTSDDSRRWYEDRGMTCFRPNERQVLKNYLEVPPDTVEDRDELRLRVVEAASV